MASVNIDDELMEKLRELRGPSPPPRPSTPFSDIPIQLKSETLITSKFLNSFLSDGNLQSVVFSPALISSSLDMALFGAKNETLDEINEIFGKDFISGDKYLEGLIYFKSLIYSNKITLLPSFIDYCNKNDSRLLPVDFDNLEQTIKKINSKVSEKTKNKISKLLETSQITPALSLCVGSAATFIAQWAFSFPFNPPKPAIFYSNPPRKIDMIQQKEKELWMFSEGNDWECMSINYQDSKNLYIVLPKKTDGLEDLIKKFDYSLIMKCVKRTRVLAAATIPVFEIESNLVLNDKLKDMGIKQLFVKNGLNKIISNEKSSHSLDFLFVHSARIKVDQFGADGRDDTEDHLKYEDIRNQPGDTCPPPNCREIDFIADQPFLFFVALWNFSGDKNRIQSIQFAGIFS